MSLKVLANIIQDITNSEIFSLPLLQWRIEGDKPSEGIELLKYLLKEKPHIWLQITLQVIVKTFFCSIYNHDKFYLQLFLPHTYLTYWRTTTHNDKKQSKRAKILYRWQFFFILTWFNVCNVLGCDNFVVLSQDKDVGVFETKPFVSAREMKLAI